MNVRSLGQLVMAATLLNTASVVALAEPRKLADTATQSPSGRGPYTGFLAPPSVSGDVSVFEATDAGGAGLYASDASGALRSVPGTSPRLPPGVDPTLQEFFPGTDNRGYLYEVHIAGDTMVALASCCDSGVGGRGAILTRTGELPWSLVTAGYNICTTCFSGYRFQSLGPVRVGLDGTVLFKAQRDASKLSGIYDSPLSPPIVQINDVLPDGAVIREIGDIAVSQSGFVYVVQVQHGDSISQRLYARHGASSQLLTDNEAPLPGAPNARTSIELPSALGTRTAFLSRDRELGFSAIYLNDSHDTKQVVDTTTTFAASLLTSVKASCVIHDGVVFTGRVYRPGYPNASGLFARLSSGTEVAVLNSGDALDGKSVDSVQIRDDSCSGNRVGMLVYFEDGSHGLYLADVPGAGSPASPVSAFDRQAALLIALALALMIAPWSFRKQARRNMSLSR